MSFKRLKQQLVISNQTINQRLALYWLINVIVQLQDKIGL